MFNTEIHVSRCLQQGARTNRTITTAHRISCWVSSVPESDEHTLTAHLLGSLVWCSIVIPHLLQGPISEHRPFAHDVMTGLPRACWEFLLIYWGKFDFQCLSENRACTTSTSPEVQTFTGSEAHLYLSCTVTSPLAYPLISELRVRLLWDGFTQQQQMALLLRIS